MAAENLLTMADITKMTSPRLPLWITATCDFTRFDDIQTSAGEQAFLNTKGGAIALLTTSRGGVCFAKLHVESGFPPSYFFASRR